MATDFDDLTPQPDPAPKKQYHFDTRSAGAITWTAGQTFQQALAAALPAAIRQRTNATNFYVNISIEAREA